MVNLLIELVNGLMEVGLVHLLSSCLHEHEALITSLLCLHLLRNLLLNCFSGRWLRGFNHDGLVGAHNIRIIDHLGEVCLIIIFLSL
jgi:hypothetical protein